jgi:RNA polymerase sigma factor (TIGR02999 family)
MLFIGKGPVERLTRWAGWRRATVADDVADLLQQVNAGTPGAFDALVSLVYGELRRMAGSLMRRQASGHTLQPTALVNEAYLRLVRTEGSWDGRAHFFGAAARAMRQVLMAHARQRAAHKRAGGAVRVTFSDLDVHTPEPNLDLLALDEALTALARLDQRFAQVVELRYFAGCSVPEIAEITGRSLATVKRDWAYARAWLHERMGTGRTATGRDSKSGQHAGDVDG